MQVLDSRDLIPSGAVILRELSLDDHFGFLSIRNEKIGSLVETRNGLYRMRLAETGGPLTASEYTFRTLDVPSRTSAEPILNAVQIMTSNPARVGDALADLLTLPPAMADSELALRLKVLAFAQLGYTGDADATAAQLARLLQSAR